jgi:hypothetical protein
MTYLAFLCMGQSSGSAVIGALFVAADAIVVSSGSGTTIAFRFNPLDNNLGTNLVKRSTRLLLNTWDNVAVNTAALTLSVALGSRSLEDFSGKWSRGRLGWIAGSWWVYVHVFGWQRRYLRRLRHAKETWSLSKSNINAVHK